MSKSPLSKSPLTQHVEDLLWSLWTELGVPGLSRDHPDVEVDPEALIVATPMLIVDDPRLIEQALAWCVSHEDRLATNRFEGLLRLLPEDGRGRFERFAATVNQVSGSRWNAGAAASYEPVPRLKPIALPLARAGLLRLRARALCGVGARADVVTELLMKPDSWVGAEDLASTGHSKRNIARTLAELSDAGIVSCLREGNARRFSLAKPVALGEVLDGLPDEAPRWVDVFHLIILVMRLEAPADVPTSLRRVVANGLRGEIAPLAERLWLEAPPLTRGEPDAWEQLHRWATAQVELLALGISPAIVGRTRVDDRVVVGRIERYLPDRCELGMRLDGERRVLRARLGRGAFDPGLMHELYVPGDRVRVAGRGRSDLRGRLKYLESVVSIEKLAA